jgi:hypothetical protein
MEQMGVSGLGLSVPGQDAPGVLESAPVLEQLSASARVTMPSSHLVELYSGIYRHPGRRFAFS